MATYQDSRYNIALPSGSGGALVLIKTLTASSSGTLSFVNGSSDVVLDNTYRTYIFKYTNIHLASDSHFRVNFRDGSTAYDATKTTNYFIAHHAEADNDNNLTYVDGKDLAQSTDSAILSQDFYSGGNDSAIAGELYLFNPSQTTYVKQFLAVSQGQFVDSSNPYSVNTFLGGYCNVTAAIDGVQFDTSSGNIDAGTIKLYGIA